MIRFVHNYKEYRRENMYPINPYILNGSKILDIFSGAVVGYSLRCLTNQYAGKCILIRRSIDNSTLEVGFVDGKLDYNLALDFSVGGDCYVQRWYNQLDISNWVEQLVISRQPKIISQGSFVLDSKQNPTILFSGSQYMPSNKSKIFSYGDYTSIAVVAISTKTNPSAMSILDSDTGIFGGRSIQAIRIESDKPASIGFNTQTSIYYDVGAVISNININTIINSIKTSTYLDVLTNGISNGAKMLSVNNVSINNGYMIGAYLNQTNADTQTFRGTISEIIHYPIDNSSNISSLNNDLIKFYI
jgi:hypothetical protein